MPQLSQIAEIYASQLFWLLIVFGIIYFGIGRGMVSKIDATMVGRDRKIADDLAAATAARAAADATEAAYRTRMDQVRADAAKATADAKAAAARAAESRLHAADADLAQQAEAAEARLAAQREAAVAGIEQVAVEAAQEIVTRISGVTVDRDAAQRAVAGVIAHG